MKEYITYFYLNGRAFCSCRTNADSIDSAEMDAEFAMMCRYPNVKYDDVRTWEVITDEEE